MAKTTKTTKATKTTSKATISKPNIDKTENLKVRHFYVYYNGEKLSSRLSGKRPKQAAQKAISSIVKLHNELIGREIEFYIVETGRKKYKEKKIGGKVKKVPIVKRQFYYKGIRKHIPEDPNDEYYKPKEIKSGKNKGQIRKMDLEIKDGKVVAIKINRNEKDIKITKDGEEITKHINGGEVKYSYITEVKADRTKKQEKPKISIKSTNKTIKNTKKSTTPKKTTTKKTTTKKISTKKSTTPKKTTTKKNNNKKNNN